MKDNLKNKFKEKKIEIENKIRVAAYHVRDYISNNPQEAIALASATLAITAEGAKQINNISKKIEKRKDEKREACRFWDPVNGKIIYSYRPLTTRELADLTARRESGSSVTRALLEMGLIR